MIADLLNTVITDVETIDKLPLGAVVIVACAPHQRIIDGDWYCAGSTAGRDSEDLVRHGSVLLVWLPPSIAVADRVIALAKSEVPAELIGARGWVKYVPVDGSDVFVLLDCLNYEVRIPARALEKIDDGSEADAMRTPRHGDHGTCTHCGGGIRYHESTDHFGYVFSALWLHSEQIDDGHDAELGGPA